MAPEIRDLKNSGTEVTTETRVPVVAYTGDTNPRGLDENPVFFDAKILISEMTFVAPEHRKEKIHKHGHMHIDDYRQRAERFNNELIIAAHLSTRYNLAQVKRFVQKAFAGWFGRPPETLVMMHWAMEAYPLPRAAYIHVPFCRHRCGYCNFSVVADRDDLIERYLKAIDLELCRLDTPTIDTLFVGGGTPTHFDAEHFAEFPENCAGAFSFVRLLRMVNGSQSGRYYSR